MYVRHFFFKILIVRYILWVLENEVVKKRTHIIVKPTLARCAEIVKRKSTVCSV